MIFVRSGAYSSMLSLLGRVSRGCRYLSGTLGTGGIGGPILSPFVSLGSGLDVGPVDFDRLKLSAGLLLLPP
jgi:hypothetical protein